MKRVLTGLFMAGVLLGVTGCAATGGAASSQTDTAATTETPPISPENGDVGVCHSVSIELTMLAEASAAYETGSLDRAGFNVVVENIANSFGLLRIMHEDAALVSAAESLGSAIGDLATSEGEPNTGDGSEVGQLRAALSAECEEAGAPLSIYQ